MTLIPFLWLIIKCLCIYWCWRVQLFDVTNKFLRGQKPGRFFEAHSDQLFSAESNFDEFQPKICIFDAFFSAIPQPFSFQSTGFHRMLVYMENKQVNIFGQENVYEKLF